MTIEHTELSRKHIEVRSSDNEIYVRDLGTTNGSMINNTPLQGTKWYPLKESNILKLGKGDSITLNLSIVENINNRENLKPQLVEPVNFPDKKAEPTHTQEPTLVSMGNAAVKADVYTSATPASMKVESMEQEIDAISAISNKLEGPNLSEVEMLQIKKLEIDAKVAAIQIKKDAEDEVARLRQEVAIEIEQQKSEVQVELRSQNEKIDELKTFSESLEGKIELLNDEYDQIKANINLELKNKDDIIDQIDVEKNKLEELKEDILQQIERNNNKMDQLAEEYDREKDRFAHLREDLELNFREEEEIKRQEIEELNLKIKDLELVRSELDFTYKEREHELTEIIEEIQRYKNECDSAKGDYDRIQQRLDKLYQEKDEKQDILKSLSEELALVKENLGNSEHKLSDILQQTKEGEKRLQIVKEELEQELRAGKNKIEQELNALRLNETTKLEEELELKRLEAQEEVDRAHSEVLNLKNKAQEEVDQLRAEAKQKSEDLIAQAEQLKLQTQQSKDKAEKEITERVELAIVEYEKTLMSAKEKKDSLIEEANDKAADLIKEAQTRSNELVAAAQEKAVQMHQNGVKELEEARKDLDSKISAAKNSLEQYQQDIEDHELKLNDLKVTLDGEKKKALEEVAAKKEEILTLAENEAAEIRQNAQSDYAARLDQCKVEQQEIIDQAKVELERLNKAESIKLDTIKKEEMDSLNQLKAAAMEQIRNDKLAAQQELESWKKSSLGDIANSIETIVTTKLNQVSKEKLSGKEIGIEAREIRSLVEKSMSGKSGAQSAVLGLFSGGGASRGKSVRVMKKWAAIGGVVLIFILVGVLKPEFYRGISDMVSSLFKVEESAQEKYIENLTKKRKNAPKFNPDLVLAMQATLAESVIYTEDFFNIWTSKGYVQEWGVRVDNLIMYKMRLKENDVDRYLREEEKLVRTLQRMRESITPKNFEKKKREMIELDMKFEEKLIEILKSGENYETMLDAREDFYNDYANKHFYSKK